MEERRREEERRRDEERRREEEIRRDEERRREEEMRRREEERNLYLNQPQLMKQSVENARLRRQQVALFSFTKLLAAAACLRCSVKQEAIVYGI